MYIVEVMLPLYDNAGHAFPRAPYDEVRGELTDRFGGVTAFVRAPAEGLWKQDDGAVVRDDVVLFEIMTTDLDMAWWAAYRRMLCERFRQEDIVVRAMPITRL